jgi:hypothetical protein
MREAVGGSLLLYLIIPIIILFIVFIGFIMNYASAYRAANYVITQIENCQGQMNNCGGVTMESITENVRKNYGYISRNNATITPCVVVNGTRSYVFRVELPVSFDLPMFGETKWMSVRAETKTINNVPDSSLTFSRCS